MRNESGFAILIICIFIRMQIIQVVLIEKEAVSKVIRYVERKRNINKDWVSILPQRRQDAEERKEMQAFS
jgi:hypothetical protein